MQSGSFSSTLRTVTKHHELILTIKGRKDSQKYVCHPAEANK